MGGSNPVDASVQEIGEGLRRLYESLGDAEREGFGFTSNHNVIVLLSEETSESALDTLIGGLASVHPARFFVIKSSPSGRALRVTLSARCHAVSSGHSVCSEVVRLDVGPEHLPRIPSLVRAHSIAGKPTECLLCDTTARGALFDVFSPLADQILFDSRRFRDGLLSVREVARASKRLIDLEWLRLALWRDQIRDLFDRPALLKDLEALDEVVITGPGGVDAPGAVLLAGWIAGRLRLHPVRFDSGAFVAETAQRRQVRVRFCDSERPEVAFRGSHGLSIVIRRGQVLETEVEGSHSLKISRAVEDESEYALIRRFHLVGVATANYVSAFERAVEFLLLPRR